MEIHSRRKDIDGLRALAILSVLFFHINEKIVPGGFIGVDVFFVISGYLITGHILKKLYNDEFSLKEFYYKRIKRIYPVFFVVLLIFTLIAFQINSLILINVNYIPVFIYNFFIDNYFNIDTKRNFFIHFWSLSIEEQFYFILPIFLMLSSMIGKKWLNIKIIFILLFFIIFSAFFSWNISKQNNGLAYFHSIPRFGELAIGSLISILPIVKFKKNIILEFLYLFLINSLFLSFFYINEKNYPNLIFLLPSLLTGLLLYIGSVEPKLKTILIIGNPIFVFVGLISYSLYLWHWPILSLTRFIISNDEIPLELVFLDIFIILFISIFSYFYIEQKFIKKNLSFKKVFLSFLLLNFFLMIFITLITGYDKLKIKPQLGVEYTNITVDGQNINLSRGWIAPCWETDFRRNFNLSSRCTFGSLDSNTKVLLVGDSHSAAIGGFINAAGINENFKITSLQVGACQISEWGFAERAPLFVRTKDRIKACNDLINYIENNYLKYDYILIANAYNLFEGNINFFNKEYQAPPKIKINKIVEISKKTPVIFIEDSPVINRSLQYSPILNIFNINQLGGYIVFESGNNFIKKIVEKHPSLYWLSLDEEFKTFEKLEFFNGNQPLYIDTNHLSGYGSKFLYHEFSIKKKCVLCLVKGNQHEK
ncbi:acyltransferase family protein [Acinetobacter pittii]|uniref:acyltransferase family protein n=1 Tax=Acinetobacter pittii TaxID=48296 RepID=UPI0034CEA9D3